jgi:hypothetical protein
MKNFDTRIQDVWMTVPEFHDHLRAKAGYILDALADGLVLCERGQLLTTARTRLVDELQRRGIQRVNGCWVWPEASPGKSFSL